MSRSAQDRHSGRPAESAELRLSPDSILQKQTIRPPTNSPESVRVRRAVPGTVERDGRQLHQLGGNANILKVSHRRRADQFWSQCPKIGVLEPEQLCLADRSRCPVHVHSCGLLCETSGLDSLYGTERRSEEVPASADAAGCAAPRKVPEGRLDEIL